MLSEPGEERESENKGNFICGSVCGILATGHCCVNVTGRFQWCWNSWETMVD